MMVDSVVAVLFRNRLHQSSVERGNKCVRLLARRTNE